MIEVNTGRTPKQMAALRLLEQPKITLVDIQAIDKLPRHVGDGAPPIGLFIKALTEYSPNIEPTIPMHLGGEISSSLSFSSYKPRLQDVEVLHQTLKSCIAKAAEKEQWEDLQYLAKAISLATEELFIRKETEGSQS